MADKPNTAAIESLAVAGDLDGALAALRSLSRIEVQRTLGELLPGAPMYGSRLKRELLAEAPRLLWLLTPDGQEFTRLNIKRDRLIAQRDHCQFVVSYLDNPHVSPEGKAATVELHGMTREQAVERGKEFQAQIYAIAELCNATRASRPAMVKAVRA